MIEQKPWTPLEITALRHAFAEGLSRTEIALRLGRSVGSIRAKILTMGLRRGVRPWSDADIAELRQLHAGALTIAAIAEKLGRSLDAVTTMCHRLELRRLTNAIPWTEMQIDTLKELLDLGLSLGVIAEQIGHPRASVADKMRQLNLTSGKFRQPWSAEELRNMDALYAQGLPACEIAARLPGRSAHAVRLKLEKRLRQRSGASVRTFSAADGAIRLSGRSNKARANGVAARLPVAIPTSVAEMERWLRTRDYIVLHRAGGWIVDRHVLANEDALLEFVNVRRLRLNLPPFAKFGEAAAVPAAPAAPANDRAPAPHGAWRKWHGNRSSATVSV